MRCSSLASALTVALALAACSTADPPDEQCILAGGLCFRSDDVTGCGTPIPGSCATGFTCCGGVNASNIVNGVVVDAALFVDASREASPVDAGDARDDSDSGRDGAEAASDGALDVDAGVDAALDVTDASDASDATDTADAASSPDADATTLDATQAG